MPGFVQTRGRNTQRHAVELIAVSLEECEEIERLKEIGPRVLLHEDPIADFQSSLELPDHDLPCGVGDVEGGVLLGVGGGDDRHEMVAVGRVDSRVPNLQS